MPYLDKAVLSLEDDSTSLISEGMNLMAGTSSERSSGSLSGELVESMFRCFQSSVASFGIDLAESLSDRLRFVGSDGLSFINM
jgi:hypothetical protein